MKHEGYQEKMQKNQFRRLVIMGLGALGFMLFAYFLWSVSALWAPVICGVILAYMFRPLQTKFHLSWIPHEMAVILAFLFTISMFSILFFKAKSAIPDENSQLELKVRLDYKLNEKFNEVFSSQNSFVKNLGNELRPAINSISALLALSPHEQDLIEKRRVSDSQFSEKYYAYYQANLSRRQAPSDRVPNAVLDESSGELKVQSHSEEVVVVAEAESSSSHMLHWLSLWLICPFVFIFLVFDNGQIRKFFVSLVPNQYFELTLTLLDKVDEAVGSYLRGTAIECFLVGISMVIGLLILGLPFSVSVVLGMFCGLVNAVPFLGTMIGALLLLGYALIAEQIHPAFSFIKLEHLPVASMLLVGFVHLLDNALFAPIVLGRAVNLHPLVVILSLAAASTAFGAIGVVLAIPVIVIAKTIVIHLLSQLKAYKLI